MIYNILMGLLYIKKYIYLFIKMNVAQFTNIINFLYKQPLFLISFRQAQKTTEYLVKQYAPLSFV